MIFLKTPINSTLCLCTILILSIIVLLLFVIIMLNLKIGSVNKNKSFKLLSGSTTLFLIIFLPQMMSIIVFELLLKIRWTLYY